MQVLVQLLFKSAGIFLRQKYNACLWVSDSGVKAFMKRPLGHPNLLPKNDILSQVNSYVVVIVLLSS